MRAFIATGGKAKQRSGGFTLIEAVMTIVVAAIFISAIVLLSSMQSRLAGAITAYNNADRLAYNNLRTYAYGKAPTWFECVYDGSTPKEMKLIDPSTTPATYDGIPSPVLQAVTATAPYGCGGGAGTIGYPIRVTSTVTYGPTGSQRTVVHATYATY